MQSRLDARDYEILKSLADCGVLTVVHVSVLHGRNSSALRRRLRTLRDMAMINMSSRALGARRGRPQVLVSLDEQGVAALRSAGILSSSGPDDAAGVPDGRCLEHLLLVNELRIQLAQMTRAVPAVQVRFLSPTSPFLDRTPAGLPLVHEKFPEENGNWVEFTPDGVFALSHEQVPQALQFFLEVDMGTETLASPRRPKQDVRQKILNYQATYRLQRHRRVGRIIGHEFRGFRLLFLANDLARAGALCRLVKEMPPSSFIYVTDRGSLESKGVWADIWVEGGRLDLPRRSILGSRMPNPTPAPSDLA